MRLHGDILSKSLPVSGKKNKIILQLSYRRANWAPKKYKNFYVFVKSAFLSRWELWANFFFGVFDLIPTCHFLRHLCMCSYKIQQSCLSARQWSQFRVHCCLLRQPCRWVLFAIVPSHHHDRNSKFFMSILFKKFKNYLLIIFFIPKHQHLNQAV